ncbi:MAG: DUF559 domain-containing protein, partial [Pseudonocardiales bacterium]
MEAALADASRQIRDYETVLAIVADAVQNRRTTVERLGLEADVRPAQERITLFVRALRSVDRGDRSVAEAALADLIAAAGVQPPERFVTLQTAIGAVIPDFLWADLGLYAEVDGREWHLLPADWAHDLQRQNALAALGLTPLRYPVSAIFQRGEEVVREIRTVILQRVGSAVGDLPGGGGERGTGTRPPAAT